MVERNTLEQLASELWTVEYGAIADPFYRLCACADRVRAASQAGRLTEMDENYVLDAIERRLPARPRPKLAGHFSGESYDAIEDHYRRHAFHVYYYKLFADEMDHDLRFVKALGASSARIREPRKVVRWHRQNVRDRLREQRRRRPMHGGSRVRTA